MGPLSFFTTGNGVLLLGALAALIVLLWDWRVGLVVLFIEQLGIAALVVGVEDVPVQMMLVQTFIVGLACLMLATSGMQVQLGSTGRQSGGWFFRLLVLGLLAAALLSLDLRFVLPEVSPAIARLFGWLGLIALLMLGLGDHALFTAVALLLWSVLGYAVAAFYAPVAEVMVVIGLVELAVAFTCSYLILAERLPLVERAARAQAAYAPAAARPSATGAAGASPLTRRQARDATQTVAVVPPPAGSVAPAAAPPAAVPPPAGPLPAEPPTAGPPPANPPPAVPSNPAPPNPPAEASGA